MTDHISDLITRIKNGSDAGKATVSVLYSKYNENIAHALKKSGYLSSVEKKDGSASKELILGLIYLAGSPRIHGAERISKPSRRIYQRSVDIRVWRSGFGNTFLSTPKGIMIDEDARKNKVGGEVLFKIW